MRRALPILSEQDPTEGGGGGKESSVLREHEQRTGHQRGNGAGLIHERHLSISHQSHMSRASALSRSVAQSDHRAQT